MLAHSILLIEIFVGNLLMFARQPTQHLGEHAVVARVASVLLGVVHGAGEIVIVSSSASSVRGAGGLAMSLAIILALVVGTFLAAMVGLVAVPSAALLATASIALILVVPAASVALDEAFKSVDESID